MNVDNFIINLGIFLLGCLAIASLVLLITTVILMYRFIFF